MQPFDGVLSKRAALQHFGVLGRQYWAVRLTLQRPLSEHRGQSGKAQHPQNGLIAITRRKVHEWQLWAVSDNSWHSSAGFFGPHGQRGFMLQHSSASALNQ